MSIKSKSANDLPVNKPQETKRYKNPSNFGLLSDLYHVRIRLCDKEGKLTDSDEQIVAVALEGGLHISSQYSTPFDNSNPEHRMPTMMGMLQTGDWTNTADSFMQGIFGVELGEDTKEKMNSLEGRSNLTKTNSTQVFVASAPITIPLTLYFEAWENAKIEVENQVKLLQKWALPEKLEEGSLLASFAEDKSISSLFPSFVPPYVAVFYGGKKYVPMLIGDVDAPIVVPMDKDGNRMALQVPITLLSRTAWDAENINQMYL